MLASKEHVSGQVDDTWVHFWCVSSICASRRIYLVLPVAGKELHGDAQQYLEVNVSMKY